MKNISQELKKSLDERASAAIDSKPTVFDFKKSEDQSAANDLFISGKIQNVSDDYREQKNELFAVKNPSIVYTPDFKKKFEDY
ncbi:MAG: UBA/THIF-type binding fold protein, partial [Parcubacteria group bacterium]|nr:UBA/THIF-type binding fold protein [Parcubacteria group bacterium]